MGYSLEDFECAVIVQALPHLYPPSFLAWSYRVVRFFRKEAVRPQATGSQFSGGTYTSKWKTIPEVTRRNVNGASKWARAMHVIERTDRLQKSNY